HPRARAERRDSRVSTAGRLVLAPVVAAALEAMVFFAVWRTRAPLPKDVLFARAAWVACLTALLPFSLAWASARFARVRWWRAVVAAAILFGGPTAYLVRLRWAQDFQFLPWPAVGVTAGLAIATLGLSILLRDRTMRGWWTIVAVAGLPIFALVAVF